MLASIASRKNDPWARRGKTYKVAGVVSSSSGLRRSKVVAWGHIAVGSKQAIVGEMSL
jgi:hypothetical protein